MQGLFSSAASAFRSGAATVTVGCLNRSTGGRTVAGFIAGVAVRPMHRAACGMGGAFASRGGGFGGEAVAAAWGGSQDRGTPSRLGAHVIMSQPFIQSGVARPLPPGPSRQCTRAMSTHEYFDSAGRTLDPPSDKNSPLFMPWRAFRTWYTLYRLRNHNFPGVSFRDADFLAEAEKMYAEFAGAVASGDKRRVKTHVTEKVAGKVRKAMPDKEKRKGGDKAPRQRVQVTTSAASVVQARLVYFTQPQGHCFAQIICDITVASDPPHVKRVVFDRAMHLGHDGRWLISEIS